MAKLTSCGVDPTAHMLVGVANGDKAVSQGICPNLTWAMQGHTFSHPIRLLALEGCDMVLGADWLKILGNILFNFDKLTMSFKWEGHTVTLHGNNTPASMHMISGKLLLKFFRKNTHGLLGSHFAITEVPNKHSIPPPIQELLHTYQDVFQEPTSLPPLRSLDHTIPLKPTAIPTNQRPYRYPYVQKTILENMVTEMLASGIIQPSHSPFASPMILVKKRDGSFFLSTIDTLTN